MRTRILAFTETGLQLANQIAALTDGEACRCGNPDSLNTWTEKAFGAADALIYVGAAGIAVRAIAPFIKSKCSDPAVLVIDETGKFVIPILSGHIGGANALAERLAEELHASAVITTATDRHGLFAVDVWATVQGSHIPEPEYIRQVSGRLLNGKSLSFYSEFPVQGDFPENIESGTKDSCDFALSLHRLSGTLCCVPQIVVLGIGCKKGIGADQIEAQFQSFMEQYSIWPEAFQKVCTIDRKKDEPGLLEFCERHRWTLECFSVEELQQVHGTFTGSNFVQQTVGVDNVCERSALLGSGGELIISKFAGNGVTLAAAQMPFYPDWRTK